LLRFPGKRLSEIESQFEFNEIKTNKNYVKKNSN